MPDIMDEEDFYQKADVSRETMDNIRIYANLLIKWQKSINLVSDSSLSDLWRRHFYDSFQLKTHIDVKKTTKLQILDIGSGAGFPGLLLSMLGIGEFHLVESNGRKCAFMAQVIRETNSTAVIHNERVENMPPFPVDYIISRACAPLDKLFDLSRNFRDEKTVCLFLKGANAENEISRAWGKWAFDHEKFTSVSAESGIVIKASHIKALDQVK